MAPNHDYPARRAPSKTRYGPKPKYEGGSVNYTVKIPKDPHKNKQAREMIAHVLKAFQQDTSR